MDKVSNQNTASYDSIIGKNSNYDANSGVANSASYTTTFSSFIGDAKFNTDKDYIDNKYSADYKKLENSYNGTEDNIKISSSDIHKSTGASLEEYEDKNNKKEKQLANIAMYLPQWGYSDFMKERLNWQKGLNDIGGEPGWFYFRIFFHFNTASGLFGGVMKADNGDNMSNRTCAATYFDLWSLHYPTMNMAGRKKSLFTFVNMLNNISNNNPWFFQSISGMNKANVQSLIEPFKDNTLEIKCLEESIDMRLSQLFEYYKYACFDYINLKEVLPENLRKFDMSVVLFGVPIRYLDTHSKINGREFNVNTLRGSNDDNNKMTFSMYTFKECEFDIENMEEPNLSDMSNTHAFQNNTCTIKIKYKKVFNYKSNGFAGNAISTLGINDDKNLYMGDRLSKLADAYNTLKSNASGVGAVDNFVNKFISNKTQFSKWYKFARNQGVGSASKTLIDETEAICQNYYRNVAHGVFNTLVGTNMLGAGELGSITPPDHGVNTDYYKETISKLHNGSFRPDVSTNINRPVLGSSLNALVRTFSTERNESSTATYKSKLRK